MTEPLPLTILSRDAQLLRSLLEARQLPGLRIDQCETAPAAISCSEVRLLLADPNLAAQIVPDCQHLRWCQSTWAGNTPLLSLSKRDYQLTGVKGIFGTQMREYVLAYLLYFSRNIATFNRQQRDTPPHWEEAPISRLAGQTLGILGAGSIASEVAPAARALGMKVIGMSRRGGEAHAFDAIYTPDQQHQFAGQCNALLNLLPDTPQTENLIDKALLSSLPDGAILINAGRGSAIVDDDLLDALNNGTLRAAVLDVFRQEPLPPTHPFWHHEAIYITSHTAAISRPEDVIEVFAANAKRFINDEPLHYVFDFERGY
ncbi:D-2-hydroxyacid dehydrogenase [Alteromonas halophila]|uniref:2-hydroxyacid dehydrogenase n=1 Tax=Alteromonas halophila TaxID=516698 RepID=A0A918JQI0_9ALTE|nr:D-2-hydroxyacid dehydrogenase [Alteromonas halophila]GGW92910.1 2-hydroxyacid dehydrogenase [Alteromonas halophila]